jgi:hypothetical protein
VSRKRSAGALSKEHLISLAEAEMKNATSHLCATMRGKKNQCSKKGAKNRSEETMCEKG